MLCAEMPLLLARDDLRGSNLQAAGPRCVSRMLRDPGKLASICQSLLRSCAYERSGAGLLLYAASQSSAYVGAADAPVHRTVSCRQHPDGSSLAFGSAWGVGLHGRPYCDLAHSLPSFKLYVPSSAGTCSRAGRRCCGTLAGECCKSTRRGCPAAPDATWPGMHLQQQHLRSRGSHLQDAGEALCQRWCACAILL